MASYDFIIVGSGIAGLYSALLAHRRGSVLIVTKGSIEECNTRYAQGGIAAAIGPGDSAALHFKDTVSAGAGLSDEAMVHILAEEAPLRIRDLIELGVPFDTVEGEVALTLEAAHSVPRILHAGGDATGRHIEETLSARVRAAGIRVAEHTLVTEILVEGGRAAGLKTLSALTGEVETCACRHLILASGGAGQLFSLTTNPAVATGDGVALAYRAGADVMDMEFFQFHPTALKLAGAPPFLISESVRGEGGLLRNVDGRRFMTDYHEKAELAPRDIVSRAIVSEMTRTAAPSVFLDLSHLPAALVLTRFPQIYRQCREYGLDITRDLIPVAPAAHYMIGGVRVDAWGASSLPGLYAAGEVSCTGVHGANRLASNSLLEVLVFCHRIVEQTGRPGRAAAMAPAQRRRLAPAELNDVTSLPDKSRLQDSMWRYGGIVRNGAGLKELAAILAAWQAAAGEPVDRESHELRNLIICGRLLAEAALYREESRGAHFRADFPWTSEKWRRHILIGIG
ncbi:L-aspartate oxidase [Dehalogenimonas alkenigignens]|uniref:L-aspartate oxidase n=1 Tax=Dehalogenimonas alkenigignens TaxID=1217799 RepID=A0A0W0GHN5_9CHLR|nr:L-aspartate oxidase [Dehalogenimonas alkenigignens]KTB48069.1 L-aspartate oxidase [Dehalogenimonas alkenigignens]PVV84322.1 L-aspartate oxidase [Dehalogenimonas alkenigignens]